MKFTSTFAFWALPFGALAREMTQHGATWGLRAISHREPHARSWQTSLRQFNYHYDDMAGHGTFAYVVDSGVRISHNEFEGRAENFWTAAHTPQPNSRQDFVDNLDHGTHVAGIIASKTYGVAKKARILSVKVSDSTGFITASNLLAGIHEAVKDILTKGRVGKAVINLSLGGGCQVRSIAHALDGAAARGITAIQAAGNEGGAAANWCLAPNSRVITVGNIKGDWSRKSTSNYGPTVDIFGPGTDIISLSNADDKKVVSKTGTSMAAPHVAGVALGFMAGTPKRRNEIADLLDSTSTKDKLKGDLRGSPNKLVNNNNNKQKP